MLRCFGVLEGYLSDSVSVTSIHPPLRISIKACDALLVLIFKCLSLSLTCRSMLAIIFVYPCTLARKRESIMQKHMTLGVLVFLGAVAACVAQTDCTFGSYDLSSIGTQSLQIQQMYKGATTTQTWVFNFCSPANQPPPNTDAACSGAGYVSEYSLVTQPKCETFWSSQNGSSSSYEYVQLNYTGGQSMNPLWTAVVNLNCDREAGALSSTGPVAVTATPGTNVLQFVFDLVTQAVCPSTATPSNGTKDTTAITVAAVLGGIAVIAFVVIGIVWRRRRRSNLAPSSSLQHDTDHIWLLSASSAVGDSPSLVRVTD